MDVLATITTGGLTMDFNKINYGEILAYKDVEKNPVKFLDHFRCTIDRAEGKMVGTEKGEFVITEAAMNAIHIAMEELYKQYRRSIRKLQILTFLAVICNLLAFICNLLR